MVAQTADVVYKLGGDILLKRVRQIVHGAGEHEVLPYQQSKLVTDVIEEVVGIVAAAPDPDAVHVGSLCVLQQTAGALRVDSGKEIVLGDVIGAHGKDVHTVDAVAEAFAPLILTAADGHGAKADAPAPNVQLLALGTQGNAELIQRLTAEAGRPPELGILDDQLAVGAAGSEDGAVGSGDGNVDPDLVIGITVQIGMYAQTNRAVFMELIHPNVLNTGFFDADDGNVPPDAGVRQTGTPVPAEHAVGFADVREAHHGIRAAVCHGLCVCFLNILSRRAEGDGDGVLSGTENGLNVELPDSVHIAGLTDDLTVDMDGGDGVQSLCPEQNLVPGEKGIVHLEAAEIDKIVVHQL